MDSYACTEDANAVFLSTDWPEFKNLDWFKVKEKMQSPFVILDGRNALDKLKLSDMGFSYYGIGR